MDIIGNRYLVDFGMAKAILYIESGILLTFTITEKDGNEVNITEAVAIKLTQIRPELYMVSWKEKSGTTVTQVHDYENGIVYSNWTSPDGEFTNRAGTLKQI